MKPNKLYGGASQIFQKIGALINHSAEERI